MIFNLGNEFERDKFKQYVNTLYEAKAIVEVKKKLPNRSLSQNAYLHLILGWFACEYGCSTDEVKVEYFKRECNRVIFERKKINKQGIEITYLRSSAELDTGEMTNAIDRFRNWASAQGGIYLPSPNEKDYLLHIQQELEKSKEFI